MTPTSPRGLVLPGDAGRHGDLLSEEGGLLHPCGSQRPNRAVDTETLIWDPPVHHHGGGRRGFLFLRQPDIDSKRRNVEFEA